MKRFALTCAALTALFSPLLLASFCLAEQPVSEHSAYRVTTYNLGAFVDSRAEDGNNFNPLMITSTAADILTNEHKGTVSWVEIEPHRATSSGIAVAAEIEAGKNVSLHGAFGITRNLWTADSSDYENSASWEANLGVIYKLLNNLSYELHFGYMDPGDLFTNQSSYTDVESVIMVSNRLTMSF